MTSAFTFRILFTVVIAGCCLGRPAYEKTWEATAAAGAGANTDPSLGLSTSGAQNPLNLSIIQPVGAGDVVLIPFPIISQNSTQAGKKKRAAQGHNFSRAVGEKTAIGSSQNTSGFAGSSAEQNGDVPGPSSPPFTTPGLPGSGDGDVEGHDITGPNASPDSIEELNMTTAEASTQTARDANVLIPVASKKGQTIFRRLRVAFNRCVCLEPASEPRLTSMSRTDRSNGLSRIATALANIRAQANSNPSASETEGGPPGYTGISGTSGTSGMPEYGLTPGKSPSASFYRGPDGSGDVELNQTQSLSAVEHYPLSHAPIIEAGQDTDNDDSPIKSAPQATDEATGEPGLPAAVTQVGSGAGNKNPRKSCLKEFGYELAMNDGDHIIRQIHGQPDKWPFTDIKQNSPVWPGFIHHFEVVQDRRLQALNESETDIRRSDLQGIEDWMMKGAGELHAIIMELSENSIWTIFPLVEIYRDALISGKTFVFVKYPVELRVAFSELFELMRPKFNEMNSELAQRFGIKFPGSPGIKQTYLDWTIEQFNTMVQHCKESIQTAVTSNSTTSQLASVPQRRRDLSSQGLSGFETQEPDGTAIEWIPGNIAQNGDGFPVFHPLGDYKVVA